MTATGGDPGGHEQPEIGAEAHDRSDADFFDTDDVNESALSSPSHSSSSKTKNTGKLAKHTHETSHSPPPYRPNRWKGSDEEWLRLTQPERDVIDQLDELDNQDWAKGLYRAYLNKERRRSQLEDDQDLQMGNMEEDWTTWPLHPEDIAQDDNRIEYKFRKQREPSTSPRESQTPPTRVAHIDPYGRQYNAAPEGNSDSSDDDGDSDPPSIADMTEAVPSYDPHVFKSDPDLRRSSALEEILIAQMMKTGKERFRERMSKPGFQSAGYTVSVDDESMTTKLRPIARNVITRFDSLLLGMHQTGGGGRGHMGADTETAYGYNTSVRRSSVKSYRKRSRTQNSDSGNDADVESASEFRGRSNKRSDSKFTKGKGKGKSNAESSSRGTSLETEERSVTHSPSEEIIVNRTWESVMLVASLQDWPAEVLERANQRLQGLFGKTATLASQRTDVQADHWDESLVCPVAECPRHVEPFREGSDLDRHMELIHGGRDSPRPFSLPTSSSQSGSPSRTRGTLSAAEEDQGGSREWRWGTKGNYVDPNLICPVEKCKRHKEPFSRLWNLKEHMRVRHPGVDLPESIQPQSKTRPQTQLEAHSRPASASSRQYKSDDVVGSTDEDQKSGREESRDNGKIM